MERTLSERQAIRNEIESVIASASGSCDLGNEIDSWNGSDFESHVNERRNEIYVSTYDPSSANGPWNGNENENGCDFDCAHGNENETG